MFVPAPVRRRQLSKLDACIAKHTFTDSKATKHPDIQITCIPIDIRDQEALNRRIHDELRFLFTGHVCHEIQEVYASYFTSNGISIEERRERAWRSFLSAMRAHNRPAIVLRANKTVYALGDAPQKRIARLSKPLQRKAAAAIKQGTQEIPDQTPVRGRAYSKFMVHSTDERTQVRRLPEEMAERLSTITPRPSSALTIEEWREHLSDECADLSLPLRPLSAVHSSHSASTSALVTPRNKPGQKTLTANVLTRYRSSDMLDGPLSMPSIVESSTPRSNEEPTRWYEIYRADIMAAIKSVYRKNI